MEWFKFYHNKWLTDRAVNALRPQDRLCFITLLCVTSQSDERNGTVTHYSDDEIIRLTQLRVNVYDDQKSDYHLALGFTDRLVEAGLIERLDDKTILIKNFEKRQNTNLSPAERSKKYRESTKSQKKVTNVTKESDERNAREEKSREDKIPCETEVSPVKERFSIVAEEDKPTKKPPAFDPKPVYAIFNSVLGVETFPWVANRTERLSAQNLLKRGSLAKIRSAVEFAKEHEDHEHCPLILKPSDLDRKWDNLKVFKQKNG